MDYIRIATRSSNLAIAQTKIIVQWLKDNYPTIKTEIYPITCNADKLLNKNISEIGGKGVFIKEVQEAILNGECDIAVHSYKDYPYERNNITNICALSHREDVRDVLISKYNSIKEIPSNGIIGTSSLRRKHQILNINPNLKVVPIRGNINTRIQKLNNNIVSGIIVAKAGINRLELNDVISQTFEITEILPGSSQGIIAIECLKNNTEILKIFQKFNSHSSNIISISERNLMKRLNADCNSAVAIHGYIKKDILILKALIFYNKLGQQGYIKEECYGSISEPLNISNKLYNKLYNMNIHEYL